MRLVLILLGLILLVGCGALEQSGGSRAAEPPSGVPEDAQMAIVAQHVDGDTLWVEVSEPGGLLPPAADHRVRLLQVDTPEVAGSPQGAQCYGEEASAFTAAALPLGAMVWLEADIETTDQFDRSLRYLWTDDGTLFNEVLVAQGYAEAVLFQPNDARIETMRAAERAARRAGAGLWGACQR